MSIASEITRLQEAKADIKTAIENKGVTVPAAATLDEYASLVNSISGGGSVDWESIARGMLDFTTSFELPSGVAVKANNYVMNGRTNLHGNVEIANTTTSIGINSFFNCTGVTNYTIPSAITSIGNSAFQNNTSIEEITIPDSVTSLGQNTLRGCTALKSVTIGSGVRTIAQYCFTEDNNIIEMIFLGTTPPTLQNLNNSLGSASYTYPIYVPDSAVATYKAASSWVNYANRVKGISERPTS